MRRSIAAFTVMTSLAVTAPGPATAQAVEPSLVDPALAVRTVVSGLEQPIHMAFLADGDFLVLEKATGRVKRVLAGAVQSTVLDLAVNSGSERGLLSIALHPDFPANPGVYLYWSESATGADTDDLAAVPLLGNRVDRDDAVRRRIAATALAADADRRQPRRGAAAPVHAARRAIQRPRVQLEVRAASGGHRVHARAGLGSEYEGDLFLGAARTDLPPSNVEGAEVISRHLFRMKLASNRKQFRFTEPRLADKVADNLDKHDVTESESLLFGRDFGVGADVRTGPNGHLYVVSLTSGAVYEIFRR